MNYIVTLSRIIVGTLFIFSGFIKLNDPLGFSFKLEEYFSRGVLNIPFLEPFALAIAIGIVLLELMLGIMLLLGFRIKFTLRSLLVMIIFFLFLTFYSAYFNKVTDCGCFGDALKLTPWQSFYKDAILFILILFLFFGRKRIQPFFSKKIRNSALAVLFVMTVIFAYYVLNHLPLFDFLPYKTGVNIKEGMAIPHNAPKAIYEYAWKFNSNGKEKTIITFGAYPSVEGEFIGVKTTLIQKGYEPPIHDFTIVRNGQDDTEMFLAQERLVIVIAYDLQKAEPRGLKKIKQATDKALQKGYTVIGISSATQEEAISIKQKYKFHFDFYVTDQTTLKTMIRSNPGIMRLKRGTIVQKLHYNDAEKLNLEAMEHKPTR